MKALELRPEEVNTILLVDWPALDIPRTLVQAGFMVYSYSPDGYKQILIEMVKPIDPGLSPVNADEFRTNMDKLVFLPMNHPPAAVDLVTIFRPPEEHVAIIREQVIPLAARTIWLQPPVESGETKKLADELGLKFVQGHDIREIIR
jgi:predicted CoA-binding protein